jgi:hypothetical protein
VRVPLLKGRWAGGFCIWARRLARRRGLVIASWCDRDLWGRWRGNICISWGDSYFWTRRISELRVRSVGMFGCWSEGCRW